MRAKIGGSRSKRSNTATLGVAALVLIGMVGMSYHEWRRYSRADANFSRNREVVGSVDSLLFSLADAESGQRGFLLTGDSRYLQPYTQAVRDIPGELAHVNTLLGAQPRESANVARLDALVAGKLAKLRQTIQTQRSQGVQPAVSLVLAGEGEREMDEIRALGAEMKQRANSTGSKVSRESAAAAATALVVTVAGSLILLFLFAFGLEPFASADPRARARAAPVRYGAAVLAVLAAILLRMALAPLMTPSPYPLMVLFLPAVLFAAWFGGFRPGILSIILSAIGAAHFFMQPIGSFTVHNPEDQVALLVFVLAGFGTALLSLSQGRAMDRAIRAEEAERNERERFATTLTSIGDAVLATDTSGRVTYLNPVAERLTGWESAEGAGRPLEEVFRIISEDSRQTVENPVAKALRERVIVSLANHTLLVPRAGEEVPIDDSAAPIRDARGEILGAVLIFRSVAEKRAAEKRLAEQAVELRQRAHLMERAQLCVRDLDDRLTYWNRGAEELYGFCSAEAMGQVSHALLRTEFPVPVEEIRLELMSRGEWDGELLQTKRDGSRITVASHWALHRDEAGRPAAILEVDADISDGKRAHAELRQRQQELAFQVGQFETLFRELPVGVAVSHDPACERMRGNPAFEQFTGVPEAEKAANARPDAAALPFRILRDGREIPAEDLPMQVAARTGRAVRNYEFELARADGERVFGLCHAVPLFDTEGRTSGSIGVILDITERKRTEERRLELLAKERALQSERALRETEAELARVTRALSLGELASSIAHEVNQPLAAIVTNAEAGLRWLRGDPPNLEEAKESLANIAEDGTRAGEVIRRLREFLKKRNPETMPLAINDVVQEAVALAGAELARRRVGIRVELSDGLPPVQGDRIQLQQVIVNLIVNGAEAMAATAAPKELLIGSRASAEGGVLVAVRDSGTGIGAEDMSRMFDPFFTTKPSGMGMGLSISRSILEAHRGRIWAEPNDGRGLTVQFSLPAARLAERSSAARRES